MLNFPIGRFLCSVCDILVELKDWMLILFCQKIKSNGGSHIHSHNDCLQPNTNQLERRGKKIKTDYTYSTLDILIWVVGSTVVLSIHTILQNPAYLWFPEYSFFFFFFSFSYMSVFYASTVGSVVKNCRHCRRPKRCRFNPCVAKICWRRKWEPTPVLLPSKFHGQGSLVGYSPWGHKHDWAPMQPSCVL